MNRVVLAALYLALLSPLSACESQSPPESKLASAAPESEKLAADTPRTTADGNRFVAPRDWSIRTSGPAVILEAPEGDSHIALIDVRAKDADAAVDAAWAAYGKDATWPLKLATDRPPRDGWEQIRNYEYETSPNEQRIVSAGARRRGAQWTVTIFDVSNRVAEKRGGQIALIFDRLLPKGYERESFAGEQAHRLDAARIAALGEFVETAQKESGVPGVAVGLVQNGEVVFEGGFGVRELGKPDPVDADTLFMIASNTKAMTTLMLARLVDDEKLDWDTPVTKVLPDFELGDADTTRQVLVKHLICACTGLPRQDMEWLFQSEGITAAMTLQTLATMQPTTKFGELFQYSNPMAAAAGYAGGHVLYPDRELGAAYDAAMQSQVFDPLGMTATTFDYDRAQQGNYAKPHGPNVEGEPVIASMDINYTVIPARPAGAAWSNVRDVLRYVQMELANGRLSDGERYVSEEALRARHEPQVAMGNDETYGMGLMVDRTYGVPVVHHGGDLAGYHSDMMWLPEHGVGAVVLTNADPGWLIRGAFRRRLLEVLFDGKPEAAAEVASQATQYKANRAAERKRLVVPAAAAETGKLASRYVNPALGEVTVRRDGMATVLDAGEWHSDVASRKNDDGSLSLVTITPGVNGFEFVVADEDGQRALVLRDAQHEYRFIEAK
ncbi:MAG: serine hydrolase [Luteitalea sp.]|nr:serine hydrolase [Luteitalea sp.]